MDEINWNKVNESWIVIFCIMALFCFVVTKFSKKEHEMFFLLCRKALNKSKMKTESEQIIKELEHILYKMDEDFREIKREK